MPKKRRSTVAKDQSIIDKITALITKSKCEGCTEAEAQSFAAKAAELMEKHAVEEHELGGDRPDHIQKDYTVKDINPWRRLLIQGCAKAAFCELVTYGGSKDASIVGRPLNTQVCIATYEFIEKQVIRIARELFPGDTKSARRAEGGLAEGVLHKLYKTQTYNQESRLPVIQEKEEVSKATHVIFPELRIVEYRQPKSTFEHFEGKRNADRIKVREDMR